jgi:hypothetical protein
MPAQSDKKITLLGVVTAGVLAWVVPGAGYWAIGDRRRGLVVGVTILLTFALGLYIGSIGVIDPLGARYWYAAQIMVSPAVLLLGRLVTGDAYTVYGRPYEIGQIYTSIAGLLNLLCIINAVYVGHLRWRASREDAA